MAGFCLIFVRFSRPRMSWCCLLMANRLAGAFSEAMAMGLPAIVTDNGGSCELVEDGVSGFVVPHGNAEALGQAIMNMAQSEHSRLMFGASGRKAAEARFDARDCARSISALFQGCCESSIIRVAICAIHFQAAEADTARP